MPRTVAPKTQAPRTYDRFLRLDHFAAAQAGRAYAHTFGGSAHAGVHGTQIHVPAPLGDVVSVADAVSKLRLLAADITLLCHDCCRSFQRPLRKLLFYRIRAPGDNSRLCPMRY